MNIDDEILINKYGQELLGDELFLKKFDALSLEDKRQLLTDLAYLIIQSNANFNDVEQAIINSKLKPTFTPCVLLKKGVANHVLYKIIELPENELKKAFSLFINLFKLAYKRRYQEERNDFNKWWYWDLSDENKVKEIKKIYSKSGAS